MLAWNEIGPDLQYVLYYIPDRWPDEWFGAETYQSHRCVSSFSPREAMEYMLYNMVHRNVLILFCIRKRFRCEARHRQQEIRTDSVRLRHGVEEVKFLRRRGEACL